MKRIAVLTSGGDAPGMNAAIRAVVRIGVDKKWQVFGVRRGYAGLLDDNFIPLGARDVSGILQKGGTMLGSARCPEFKTDEGLMKALGVLRQREIEGLIVIGGNGSQTGAKSKPIRKPSRLNYAPLTNVAKGEIANTSLTEVVAIKKPLDLQRLELAKVLAK